MPMEVASFVVGCRWLHRLARPFAVGICNDHAEEQCVVSLAGQPGCLQSDSWTTARAVRCLLVGQPVFWSGLSYSGTSVVAAVKVAAEPASHSGWLKRRSKSRKKKIYQPDSGDHRAKSFYDPANVWKLQFRVRVVFVAVMMSPCCPRSSSRCGNWPATIQNCRKVKAKTELKKAKVEKTTWSSDQVAEDVGEVDLAERQSSKEKSRKNALDLVGVRNERARRSLGDRPRCIRVSHVPRVIDGLLKIIGKPPCQVVVVLCSDRFEVHLMFLSRSRECPDSRVRYGSFVDELRIDKAAREHSFERPLQAGPKRSPAKLLV
ncbi:hypothetical protein IWX92DRAFT_372192 [Phyllosticta citricarpa]